MRTKFIRAQLESAFNAASLDNASFSMLSTPSPGEALPYPTREEDVTAFIRERVRLHHETWILGPIDAAIREIDRSS